MSIQNSATGQSPKRRDFTVAVDGPIIIHGILRRKDDVVSLTPREAKSYSHQVEPTKAVKAEGKTAQSSQTKFDAKGETKPQTSSAVKSTPSKTNAKA